jgi:lysophospholipase L1-like esterase
LQKDRNNAAPHRNEWRSLVKPLFVALAFWGIIVLTWSLASRHVARGGLHVYRILNAELKPSPRRVVFLGDSITYRWNLFRSFPGADYVNRGLPGETSADMLLRYRQDVIELQPRAVVILAGVNDFLEDDPVYDENEQFKIANLEANDQSMAELSEFHHIHPVFISLLPLHEYTSNHKGRYSHVSRGAIYSTNQWLRIFCAEHHYQYIDAYSAMIDQRGMLRKELSEDGVHPNDAGYQVVTDVFSSQFRDEWLQ